VYELEMNTSQVGGSVPIVKWRLMIYCLASGVQCQCV